MLKIIVFVFVLLFAGAGISLVPGIGLFEEDAPSIEINATNGDTIYINPKNPFAIALSDKSGIGDVEISFVNNLSEQKILSSNFSGKKNLLLQVELPKTLKYKNGDAYGLKIKVNDTSYAKFFTGNTLTKEIKMQIDTRPPDVLVINQSYKIIQGGAAVAVFRVSDTSGMVKDLHVASSFGKEFKVVPFYKEGYYAVLLAWPTTQQNFSAQVVATDLAGNIAKMPIRLYLQSKKYKESHITINNAFIDGKISELANMYASNVNEMDAIAKFKFVNEELRNANEKLIHNITSKIEEESLSEFFIKPFYPLRNGATVASFGDHRFFHFDGALLSESYHMGLDFASTAMATIVATNPGKVVFAEENGIYGLNLIIYHGFGLYTLYGHCTSAMHQEGEMLAAGANLATTGTTGLALGDHLHFGVIIQGIEVRPEEWMDKKWMKENVFDILENSKKSIDGIKNS